MPWPPTMKLASQPAISPISSAIRTWLKSMVPPVRFARVELHMDDAAIGIKHTLMHHLGQGGMREDGVHQLFLRGFQIHRDDKTLNELGDICSYHVSAKQRAGLGVENRFYEALVLAQGNGFAVTRKGKAAHPYVPPFGLCPDFSQANGS